VTSQVSRRPASDEQKAASGWSACRPELVIAGVFVVASTAAIYAFAGPAAAVIGVSIWAVTLLILLRLLVPPSTAVPPPLEQDRRGERAQTSFIGFWRKRGGLIEATASMASYDAELRPTLQHLLAARLAERHGISLYQDPAAARKLLLPSPRDEALWYWLDTERPAETSKTRRGIPPQTLAAIIDRLERL
jgi:hypothetical protein